MRKRKRHGQRERTSQWVERGEDIGCVDVSGIYRQGTQVKTSTLSQAKTLELLWVLELSHPHLCEPGSVIILTLPEALWSPIPVSSSTLGVSGGNCWVFWIQLKQKGCMSFRHLYTLSRDHTCDGIGHLNAQGPSCSSWGCVPYAVLTKSRCTHITTSQDACLHGGTPTSQGKGQGDSSEEDQRWLLAIFSTICILSFQSDCIWSQGQRPHA